MKRDNSGAAYPRPVSEDRTQGDQCDGTRTVAAQDGLTKRELFAMAAMQGLLACGYELGSIHVRSARIANVVARSVSIADALLAELAKGGV